MTAYEIQDGTLREVSDPPRRADLVEVVRCRDCRHYHGVINGCDEFGDKWSDEYANVEPDGFCAWGERRADA